MPAYDHNRFVPPAPVAEVDLSHGETGATWARVPMLLDSGADVTLIPRAAATRLGVAHIPGKQYELVGFDGRTSFASAVHLKLTLMERTFRGQFLLIDQEYGILGRNILNILPIVLDGPRLQWSELEQPQA